MSQNDIENYEYEARAMINEETYLALLDEYKESKLDKKLLTNINIYYDNKDLFLTNNHIVLRLREIDDSKKELTLKIKGENGDIELTHSLTYDEYNSLKEETAIPTSNVKSKLVELGIKISDLKEVVTLKTERLEVYFKKYIFVIDKNYFRNKIDFNVEVESTSKRAAIHYLNKKMRKYNVKYKKGYISKSRRAIFDL